MVRGFYTAGSGMVTSSRKLDISGDNIANSRTAGYKKEGVSTSAFQENLIVKIDSLSQQQVKDLGNVHPGQTIDSVYTDFTQGTLEPTDNPHNLAIAGEGFFTIQAGNGTLYTRNGDFAIDAQGFVVHASGGRLMGANGAINTGGRSFTVSADGGVYVDEQFLDTLAMYTPANPNALVKHGEGLFANTGAAGQQPFTGSVHQGYAEVSNVNMINEMMEMMSSQRAFQSCSQVVRMIDETVQQAIEVGKMN